MAKNHCLLLIEYLHEENFPSFNSINSTNLCHFYRNFFMPIYNTAYNNFRLFGVEWYFFDSLSTSFCLTTSFALLIGIIRFYAILLWIISLLFSLLLFCLRFSCGISFDADMTYELFIIKITESYIVSDLAPVALHHRQALLFVSFVPFVAADWFCRSCQRFDTRPRKRANKHLTLFRLAGNECSWAINVCWRNQREFRSENFTW